MFFGLSQSIRTICLRSPTIVKCVCNARVPIDPRATSGYRGAALAFRMRSNPDTFSVAAGWSSLSLETRSLPVIGRHPSRRLSTAGRPSECSARSDSLPFSRCKVPSSAYCESYCECVDQARPFENGGRIRPQPSMAFSGRRGDLCSIALVHEPDPITKLCVEGQLICNFRGIATEVRSGFRSSDRWCFRCLARYMISGCTKWVTRRFTRPVESERLACRYGSTVPLRSPR